MARPKIPKAVQKRIAKERIVTLFKQAELSSKEDMDQANRYVDLARKIAMRVKMPIPKEYKQLFCKHCYSYLVAGKNSRHRINNGKVIISCFKCKKYKRIQLNSKIQQKID